jgi:hypothetical protein
VAAVIASLLAVDEEEGKPHQHKGKKNQRRGERDISDVSASAARAAPILLEIRLLLRIPVASLVQFIQNLPGSLQVVIQDFHPCIEPGQR